ncbi:hypothetical protein C9374_006990 [Naegleria lovaniensis]|uniref:Uncharacterized protein n=1 Tax=Naegleria lovaniensis TaxID=51637 RepID=A0AA88KSA2_NAELO|nr:uncharacterized protein C9374_006990 [Naegleria lovaniensis]KAG2393459.1 hypothetical protein C9374_006990 [Naegleria lovaniensis]
MLKYSLLILSAILAVCACVSAAVTSPLTTRVYFGGSFASFNGTTFNNIGYYDLKEQAFKAMSNGTDGPVHVVHVDFFGNVLIGGAFTQVGSLKTGPIAMWRIDTAQWTSVTSTISFNSGASVSVIDTNCANIATSTSAFPCDIFIGGQFTITSPAATNIAYYKYSDKEWKAFSGFTANSVSAIAKNEFQTTTLNKVFLGGNFTSSSKTYGFGIYDTSKSTFTGVDGVSGVTDIYFNPNLFSSDDIFVVATTFPSTTQCVGLCTYKHTDGSWSTKAGSDPMTTIRKLAYMKGTSVSSVGTVFIAGSSGVKKATAGGTFSSFGSPNVNVYGMDICGTASNEALTYCSQGSVAAGGQDFLYFYNAKTNAWTNLLSAYTSSNYTVQINSIYVKVSSAVRMSVSMVVLMIALIASVFFF